MKSSRAYLVNLLMKLIPSTRCFGLKRILLTWAGATIGLDVKCASESAFLTQGKLKIGDFTWLGHGALFIGGDAEISIGANCDIAPRVCFVSGSHEISYDGPRVAGKGFSLPICIEDGCWIGAGSIILGGAHVGKNSIVAAGALVKGKFPERCVIGGVPAKILKNLDACDPER